MWVFCVCWACCHFLYVLFWVKVFALPRRLACYSLVGQRHEAGKVFDIRVSYVSYCFILGRWLTGIGAGISIVLGTLLGQSGGRSVVTGRWVTIYLVLFILRVVFCSLLWGKLIKCTKKTLSLHTDATPLVVKPRFEKQKDSNRKLPPSSTSAKSYQCSHRQLCMHLRFTIPHLA